MDSLQWVDQNTSKFKISFDIILACTKFHVFVWQNWYYHSLQVVLDERSVTVKSILFVSGALQRRVDEVTKLAELRRKEQERNFRLAYD